MYQPFSVDFVEVVVDEVFLFFANLDSLDISVRNITNFGDFAAFACWNEDMPEIVIQILEFDSFDRQPLFVFLKVFSKLPVVY